MACRNLEKGHAAVDELRAAVPGAQVELEELDLASLASVRGFAERFNATHDGLDLLINNAGVMGTPRREDRGRLRAPVRHEPPRPLRPHRRCCWG